MILMSFWARAVSAPAPTTLTVTASRSCGRFGSTGELSTLPIAPLPASRTISEPRTLSPLPLEKDVEFYEVTLLPGGVLKSAAHYTGTREFLTVEKGRIRVTSGADSEDLDKGDSVSYRADVPHEIVNRGTGEAVVFLVDIYR